MEEIKTKKCRVCGEEKELDAFVNHKGCKFGKDTLCKECRQIYLKSSPNVHKSDSGKKYYENNKEKHKIGGKKWYEKNRDKILSDEKIRREEKRRE